MCSLAAYDELTRSFSASLKQVTGDTAARPHATRATAPLERLLPGWEELIRGLLAGTLSGRACADYGDRIQRRGFTALIKTVVATGHGHPVTFLAYYFALWDLMMAVHARALLERHPDPLPLIKLHCAEPAHNSFIQARRRAVQSGQHFDAWLWALTYAARELQLPALRCETDLKAPPNAASRPEPRTSTSVQESSMAQYLALRLAGCEELVAALHADVSQTAASRLEDWVLRVDRQSLQRRCQSSQQARGRVADIEILKGGLGTKLIARLQLMPTPLLADLGHLLTSERSIRTASSEISAIETRLLSVVGHLPDELALLVQFSSQHATPEQQAGLLRHAPRIVVGSAVRDLGRVPRVSVVDAADPLNAVRRARWTSVVRCSVVAVQLVKKLKEDKHHVLEQ